MKPIVRGIVVAWVVGIVFAVPVAAGLPGTDIVVPAAARGGGAQGSLWFTSLYLANPSNAPATATVSWVFRDSGEAPPAPVTVTVPPGATRVLDDPISDDFGLAEAAGAFRVVSDQPLVVSAAILNRAAGTEFGQGFEGVPVHAAVTPGRPGVAVGVMHTGEYRSNLYLMDATGSGSVATAQVLDSEGAVVAAREYSLGPWQPALESLDRLEVEALAQGTVRFVVTSGAVVAGVSRVNNDSGDPVTLGASWPHPFVEGFAPVSVVGRSYTFVAIDPDAGLVESQVVFETGESGTIFEFGEERPFTYEAFQSLGSIATLTMTIPAREVEDMQVILKWSSPSEGIFSGVFESPVGPYGIGGTFTDQTAP